MKNKDYISSKSRFLTKATAIVLLIIIPFDFAKSNNILAIRIWPTQNYTRITFESNTELKYNQFSLNNPRRIILDLKEIKLNNILNQIATYIQNQDKYIKLIRIGQFDSKSVRIVFELKTKTNPHFFKIIPINKFNHRLVLNFYPYRNNNIENKKSLILSGKYKKNFLEKKIITNKKNTKIKPEKPIIIMIDPGHGGEDTGAIGKYKTLEKNIVLKIANHLNYLISKEPKMQSYMTRNNDIFIPLKTRIANAQKIQADLFISIHADAFINRSASGSSVFALSTKGATSNTARYLARIQNKSDLIGGINKSGDLYLDHTMIDLIQTATINDSLKFGNEVLKRISKINKLHKNKVDQAGFAVLRSPEIPSILVETAFISNLEEERKLNIKKFQQKIAESVLNGIKDYFFKGGKLRIKN
ncbi:N-acetylmuramoyl-L-alanine amidase AmiC [Candidatus Providencia siddallii]|uniref:N-acetylmuramoyl-L-alanine amidase AmiC n=1 Tax=Candidatus Providencia siddallii TaxID=1715285 RepID=A0A0M6W7X4_9GAMM|nr:N-acetylmuramoyl-L-alanine amidase AmiC [Candidatus Providencia siddallii]